MKSFDAAGGLNTLFHMSSLRRIVSSRLLLARGFIVVLRTIIPSVKDAVFRKDIKRAEKSSCVLFMARNNFSISLTLSYRCEVDGELLSPINTQKVV